MRWLVIALAVLAAFIVALIVGPMILGDKGYVLISLGNTAIETSLIGFCIIIICAIISWYIISKLVLWTLSLVTGSHRWFGALGERKRKRAFYHGLQSLAAGDLKSAHKALSQTTNGDFEGVNYLAAAQVAQSQNDPQKARYFLLQAAEYDSANVAAAIVMARIDVSEGKHTDALEKLDSLNEEEANNPQVIQLKASIMAEQGQWQTLQEKLSGWRKALPKEDYTLWSQRIAKGKLAEIASKNGAAELKTHWEGLPRKIKQDDAYRAAYIQQLLEQGMHAEAQTLLVEWQKKGPHPVLFPYFTQLNIPNAAPSLRLLESWIKQDSENVALYSTLGRVAYNAGDDILAEKVLLKAVKMESNKDDLLLLSAISERRHDSTTALQYYKEGQQLV
ncbi:heme biosynthesis HemY N-terminal domain-containing protein [Alteromonas lipotrueae]|uniref:heme biosynthesis HemY N-terminal domain-containing protein n=1 Tax=Alteromonas lipotrueae TaxID=2803814 RepID=UPI001C44EE59|nr:heme biosynthesis HemY N-terminal domain-containing protein [Alteromonas lipotrueae]